jgi:Flp pilus assembly protein TadG
MFLVSLGPLSTDKTIGMIAARIAGTPISESGSSTVEFSLVFLPLLALVFMSMDVAWIVFGWACIQEGAREGARYAVTGSGQSETSLDSAIRSVVQQYSFGFAKASNISIDYYPPAGYSSSGPPASIDGTAGATDVGNVVRVTVQGVTIGTFGAIYRKFTPVKLLASASDVMQ